MIPLRSDRCNATFLRTNLIDTSQSSAAVADDFTAIATPPLIRTNLGKVAATSSSALLTDLTAGWEWQYPKNSISQDISGQGYHLTPSGVSNPCYVAGGVLNSYSLNNLNALGYLTATGLTFGNINFAVAFLWKYNYTGGSYNANFILAKDQYSSSAREFCLYCQKAGSDYSLHFMLGNGSTSQTEANGVIASFSPSAFYLAIAQYTTSDNSMKLYLNNSLLASATPGFTPGTYSGTAYFGNRWSGGAFDNYTNYLSLQHLYIWKNRVLSSDERSYLYNSGNFRFLTS